MIRGTTLKRSGAELERLKVLNNGLNVQEPRPHTRPRSKTS